MTTFKLIMSLRSKNIFIFFQLSSKAEGGVKKKSIVREITPSKKEQHRYKNYGWPQAYWFCWYWSCGGLLLPDVKKAHCQPLHMSYVSGQTWCKQQHDWCMQEKVAISVSNVLIVILMPASHFKQRGETGASKYWELHCSMAADWNIPQINVLS